ncbi:MAG: asparagine synthase (glutamine-hydrolyzing) [Pseudomonadota bacterium]
MCGLIFQYRKDGGGGKYKDKIRRALSKMAHRGPDDEGIIDIGNVVIAHRRLAVIDLQASRQPMCDPSRRYFLTYNGEIYNFKELKNRLKSHWDFKTSGDTEVILAGLICLGWSFLDLMEGMWALAFWDNYSERLLISRDRMGKKPLYFKAWQGGFVTASELPALKSLIDTPLEEDIDSTADYLRYGYYLPGTTAYRDVKEVLPGHLLTWSPGKQIKMNRYWSLKINGFRGSIDKAQEKLRETMILAVKRRMVADVEVAAFLSGGIDSSLVTAIMAKYCGVSPKTFTIGFSEVSFDERRYARKVAAILHTEHYEDCLKKWDAEELKRLITEHIGQPFADSSMLPTAMVSKLAAQRVKVALSGDGGDELFSGYQRYQARAILRWYTRLPLMFRRNLAKLIKALPEPMAHHSHSLLKKAYLFLDVTDRLETETPYIAPVMYSSAVFERLAPELSNRGHSPPCIPAEAQLDDLQAMMAGDALVYLPQDILVKVDRSSMAYSLETRAPFLDRKVIELAFSFPRYWHRRGFKGKRMLHKAFSDLLPRDIWSRRKQGFGVPIHHWFRKGLGEELESLLELNDTPIERKFVRQMLSAHRKRRRDNGYRLWNIYNYLLWQRSERSL